MGTLDDYRTDAEASRWDHAEELEPEEETGITERAVLRAVWTHTEPLAADSYRPLCRAYTTEEGCCKERGTHRVTVRVTHEDCCYCPTHCACGCYAEIVMCEAHARRYERKP